MKKAIIVRYGAYGDAIILTIVAKRLKQLGYYVILDTTERGALVFKNNPNVDKVIEHETDWIAKSEVEGYLEELKRKYKPKYFKNFSESIEVSAAAHPRSIKYIWDKQRRIKEFNVNYYEHTMNFAELEWTEKDLVPELHFNEKEQKTASETVVFGKFNVLWGLTGSGLNKFYPWSIKIIEKLYDIFPDINVITVGDKGCQEVENVINAPIQKFSGKRSMRFSMNLVEHVQLIVAPDTGLLHAGGTCETPKIGLLGHTTIENITKHFKNDYSIEADVSCAPCLRLIYDFHTQCPIDDVTGASYCMGRGIEPIKVIERVKTVYDKWRSKKMSDMQQVNRLFGLTA